MSLRGHSAVFCDRFAFPLRGRFNAVASEEHLGGESGTLWVSPAKCWDWTLLMAFNVCFFLNQVGFNEMQIRSDRYALLVITLAFLSITASVKPAVADDSKPKPLRALLVLGGCCHDYQTQSKLLSEGIEARANVEVVVALDSDKSTGHMNPVYESTDWARGYDVVIHDECSSAVKDLSVVNRILSPHRAGVPAVILHCGMHSYRTEGYPDVTPWFEFTGLQTTGHGPQLPIEITFDSAKHEITNPLRGADWKTVNEELYNNSEGKLLGTATSLARGKQVINRKDGTQRVDDCVVVWTNAYQGGAKVFATTLGHNNATVADDRYLDLVTRGLLWSCDQLNGIYLK